MGEPRGSGRHFCGDMRIRLTHPSLGDDLVRFLERMGFTVEESDYDTFEVGIGEHEPAARRAQLLLYLHVWQATRPGVAALVEADGESARDVFGPVREEGGRPNGTRTRITVASRFASPSEPES